MHFYGFDFLFDGCICFATIHSLNIGIKIPLKDAMLVCESFSYSVLVSRHKMGGQFVSAILYSYVIHVVRKYGISA
jgi:hypothetical protein